MQNARDIINRVENLDVQLIWNGLNQLSSAVTGRVLASVDNNRATISGDHRNPVEFVDAQSARDYAKYTVIANILADELRQVRQ